MLDGSVTFWLEGQSQQCPAGSFIFVPRGSAHGFGTSDTPARLLVVVTPEAIRLVEAVYELGSRGPPPHSGAVEAVFAEYDSLVLPGG